MVGELAGGVMIMKHDVHNHTFRNNNKRNNHKYLHIRSVNNGSQEDEDEEETDEDINGNGNRETQSSHIRITENPLPPPSHPQYATKMDNGYIR